MATSLLAGATLSSPPQLLLEVINGKKAEGISWAVLYTTMDVEQLGLEYVCVDTIGISSQLARKGKLHSRNESNAFLERRLYCLSRP